ncbi:AsnC family protein, partial [Acinetobacter baumannii]|nr:AsnC family protein [Acinetobacter baumannii]
MDEQAENLTPLELKIMRCLQENGRLSNAELAKLVGISVSAILVIQAAQALGASSEQIT